MQGKFILGTSLIFLLLGACQSAASTAVSTPSEQTDNPTAEGLAEEAIQEMAVPTLSTALVAHYPFNGNANDASGNGNDGTVSGATLIQDRFGNSDSAYLFDGVDDIIDIPHNTNRTLDLALEAAINFWIYYQPQPDGTFYTIVEKGDPERGGHSRYGLWVINDTVEFCVQPASTNFHNCLDSTFSLQPESWQMITAVYDGTTLTLYYNGKFDSSFIGNRDVISQSPYELFVGADRYNDTVVYLAGGVDDLRLYKRVLNEAEVMELYTAVQP